MRCSKLRPFSPLAIVIVVTCLASAQDEPPTEWIEPHTGHRVVRLSKEPGTASLYFHQNAYTADGKKLIVTTRDGLAAIDLASRDISSLVKGRVFVLVTGRK